MQINVEKLSLFCNELTAILATRGENRMGKTREDAWNLLCEYTKTPSLRAHALAVEAVMRHLAGLENQDQEKWGMVGLLHDIDYEQFPDQHCTKAAEILRERGFDEECVHAVCSHGWGICSEVQPEHRMELALYALDEMTGLVNAACLVRPSKSVLDLEVKSVRKKFKDPAFAAGVNRQIIAKGCEMLGMNLDEAIQVTIDGMRGNAEAMGLKGNL